MQKCVTSGVDCFKLSIKRISNVNNLINALVVENRYCSIVLIFYLAAK